MENPKGDGGAVKAILRGLFDGIRYSPLFVKKNFLLSQIIPEEQRWNVLKLMKPYLDAHLLYASLLARLMTLF